MSAKPIFLGPVKPAVEAMNQTTWGRGNDIQNDQMAQTNTTEGGRNAIKMPEKAESGKNRKPTEGKSKSITISQPDGDEDYCRNVEGAFIK